MAENTNNMDNIDRSDDIDKQVDLMMEENVYKTPCDYIGTLLIAPHYETNHKVLGLPGKYRSYEFSKAPLKDGGHVRYDALTVIEQDEFKAFREIAVIIEYLTTRSQDKMASLLKYDVSAISRLEMPCLNVIVTHIDEGVSEKMFVVDDVLVPVHFMVFDENKISEILNNLMKKDYTKHELSEEELVNFLYAIAFAKGDYAKKYLERCVDLFIRIEKIKPEFERDLFKALKEKIKYFYQDDLKNKRRLLTMITKAKRYIVPEGLTREEKLEFQLDSWRKLRDEEILDLNNEISARDEEITAKDKEISARDEEINNKNKEILKLKTIISI